MTKTKLAKLGITTLAAGAITLGAMTYFTGTDTIDLAKEKIENFAEKINIYESNETRLINKINELKIERDELISELSKFEGIQPEEVNEQIETLENKIAELENHLLEIDSNGETLAERIILLENEAILANTKSQELQAVIDENVVEDEPLTDLELAEITGEEVEEEIDEIIEPEVEEEVDPEYIELTYTRGGERLTIVDGLQFYYSSSEYTIYNNTDSSISYQIENTGEMKNMGGGTRYLTEMSSSNPKPLTVILSDGQTYRINIIK